LRVMRSGARALDSFGCLLFDALDCANAAMQLTGDAQLTVALGAQSADTPLHCGGNRRPAEMLAIRTRPGKACIDALDRDRALSGPSSAWPASFRGAGGLL